MQTIHKIAAKLEGTSVDTVTVADRAWVDDTLEHVDNLLSSSGNTPQQDGLLLQLQSTLRQYQMRLNLVQHRLGDPALAAAAGLTPQNATAADHVRLQAACDALTFLLEECYHNLPKEDAQRLNADLQRYTQALQRIQPRLQAHGLLALGILAGLLVLASYAFYRTGYQSLAGLQRRGRAQGRWQTLWWLCWALAYLPCAPWTVCVARE